MCSARGYIEGDIFVEVKQHTHQSMAKEIQRLQLLERCCKRPTESLRRISHGSVATHVRCGEIFSDTIIRPTHFLLILTVK